MPQTGKKSARVAPAPDIAITVAPAHTPQTPPRTIAALPPTPPSLERFLDSLVKTVKKFGKGNRRVASDYGDATLDPSLQRYYAPIEKWTYFLYFIFFTAISSLTVLTERHLNVVDDAEDYALTAWLALVIVGQLSNIGLTMLLELASDALYPYIRTAGLLIYKTVCCLPADKAAALGKHNDDMQDIKERDGLQDELETWLGNAGKKNTPQRETHYKGTMSTRLSSLGQDKWVLFWISAMTYGVTTGLDYLLGLTELSETASLIFTSTIVSFFTCLITQAGSPEAIGKKAGQFGSLLGAIQFRALILFGSVKRQEAIFDRDKAKSYIATRHTELMIQTTAAFGSHLPAVSPASSASISPPKETPTASFVSVPRPLPVPVLAPLAEKKFARPETRTTPPTPGRPGRKKAPRPKPKGVGPQLFTLRSKYPSTSRRALSVLSSNN